MKHPKIIQLIGICLNPFLLITEYIAGGNLHEVLHQSTVNLSYQQKIRIAHDTASAIKFLHEFGIIHRDLNSKNILVSYFHTIELITELTSNFEAKIIDFGISKKLENSKIKILSTQTVDVNNYMTPQYAAPEVMLQDPNITVKADIYSFGIILYVSL